MKNLKATLVDYLSNLPLELDVQEIPSGGCMVLFKNVIPELYLKKLIAFSTLYGYNYYVSLSCEDTSVILFRIYR